MPSILQDWVCDLPIRHQGVLLAAVRGCDGAEKESAGKPLTRAVRGCFMVPADGREVGMAGAFMAPSFSHEELRRFTGGWDHLPIHYVQHLMHACEVLGYKHPDGSVREMFMRAYLRMVDSLHLEPETEARMDARLTADRIAQYGNATGAKP